MAVFCSKCGAQLEGNERFCVKCGHDVTAAGAVPVAAPAPVAVAPPPMAPPPQGYGAPPPAGYGAPGPIPVMGVPPPAPPKKNNTMWIVIAIAAAAGGWYYYHNQQTQTPANNPPTPIAGPTQPGGGAPGGGPGGGAPVQPAAPVQPGGPGPGGPNAALVQAQQWSSTEEPANGQVQVQNGKWVNGSNVAIQTAVLECDQYNAAQAVIAQNQTNLTLSNPPLVPGNNATFSSFNAGTIATGVNSVNCGIVAVTPAGN
jgi:hypothetical protein